MKELKFVVKINDKTYNSWAYIKTEFKAPWGKYGYFFEKDCFDTEDEATLFIKDMLKIQMSFIVGGQKLMKLGLK